MSAQRKFKIQSIAIVASVALLAMVFGVMLNDQVIPEAKEPLMTEEAVEQAKNKAAEEEKQTAQEQATERREKVTSEIKELDQKAKATIEKADGLIANTDQLISKAGLPKVTGGKQAPLQNEKISKRLAKARDRLEKLKQ